ncbi:uncharacterized protein PAC_17502 [Phialocephala subalpina]|uniref:Heterokaryon incompatibility domain-containing protein n=1 Tax=Phialocephala subalpina TaxID=576137 RepID=A0A1L7XRC8_9HELO|nr:uncharacterized protein PAC_17502 [Phialocephala subalpina]
MFCHQCQEIVNLDIFFGAVGAVELKPDDRSRPHHKDFASFESSAEAGCTICRLVCTNPRFQFIDTTVSEQIYVRFDQRRDVLFFHTADDTGNKVYRSPLMDICAIRLSAIEGDPVTTLMPGVFTSRPVADDSSSDACFNIAQYWLKTCLETHDSMCQIKDNLPLPTRVIDVGLLESLFVTLYVSNGKHGQWLTLSHCWGKSPLATTTTRNFDNQCAGIMISTLPQTFQDAINITRKLSYRFLWIDSLCIVQDSMIDWQAESVKMNTIYSNATLNISADAAADSSQGIFNSSNIKKDKRPIMSHMPPRPNYVQVPVHSPKSGLKSTLYASIWHGDDFQDARHPLQERGWVLAEAVLSHRRLQYTSSGLAWSCATVPTKCDETRPHEIHNLSERKSYIMSVYQIPCRPLPPRYVRMPGNDARRTQIIRWWYERINEYVNRQLTFHHDQFPAFSGIARIYSDLTQYHYKAGILVEDFRRGLLWQTSGRDINSEVAPSWSWAVVRGEDTFIGIYECDYAHREYVDDPNEVELVDISVNNLGDNPFGQVLSGSLVLRGLCHKLNGLLETSNFYFQPGWQSSLFCSRARDQNYQEFGEDVSVPLDAMRLHMDIMDESNIMFWRRQDIHILRIGMFLSRPDFGTGDERRLVEATSFLILQEIPGLEDSYRRVGIARILGNGIESPDWQMKTVTIL